MGEFALCSFLTPRSTHRSGNPLIGFPEQNTPPDCFASLPDFLDRQRISSSADDDLGRCPNNPQGTSPLTPYRALPEPVLAGRQEKGAVAPFSAEIG